MPCSSYAGLITSEIGIWPQHVRPHHLNTHEISQGAEVVYVCIAVEDGQALQDHLPFICELQVRVDAEGESRTTKRARYSSWRVSSD